MNEQEITIQLSDDPFDTKKIKVQVPEGTKLMANEAYAADALSMYNLHDSTLQKTQLIEDNIAYTTRGEVSFISKDRERALIDIQSKYTAYCTLSKEPDYIVEQLEVGMEIDIKIKTNPKTGDVIASISDAIKEVKLKEIKEAIGNSTIGFTAKVKELIHGGYWVDIAGIKCFMPGSLGGLNKLHDFNAIVGKEIIVMPITFSREKDTVVVSHREYLRTMIPSTIEKLNETIKEPRIGFVTGTTKFGVFAEFDECLTGLIPKAELSEEFQKALDDRSIKPGDEITFWAKEVISDRKIILSQLGPKIDLWDGVNDKYKPMMISEGKVTKITSYGAFVELEKGISGLIHKSKLKGTDLSKGDSINVKIGSVNVSDRKITMNIA
jgi:ribosomal protein S1|tara:strand:- start:10178 stop:11320 length:1143 start_codon:yes stop_codon:yes gene_type:complete